MREIAEGLGWTAFVFMIAAIPMVIGKLESENRSASRMYGRLAAVFGGLAFVGFIATIWMTVLS